MTAKRTEIKYTVGVDEAGRGPLAGPVSVAAVIVSKRNRRKVAAIFRGIRDSKKYSQKRREELFEKIKEAKSARRIIYAVSFVSAGVIDSIGIARAVKRGVGRSIRKLEIEEAHALILLDGSLKAPKQFTKQKTIIHGDDLEPIISLASIVAKVLRDRKMARLSKKYPHYSFSVHKGYGTRAHYREIETHGASDMHRLSFLKSFFAARNSGKATYKKT